MNSICSSLLWAPVPHPNSFYSLCPVIFLKALFHGDTWLCKVYKVFLFSRFSSYQVYDFQPGFQGHLQLDCTPLFNRCFPIVPLIQIRDLFLPSSGYCFAFGLSAFHTELAFYVFICLSPASLTLSWKPFLTAVAVAIFYCVNTNCPCGSITYNHSLLLWATLVHSRPLSFLEYSDWVFFLSYLEYKTQ